MLASFLKSAALAVVASQVVYSQTFSDCNPHKGDECEPNPAFGGGTVNIDFTKGESDVFKLADGTTLDYDDGMGAIFTINKASDAPTIISNKYLFFGRVDVVTQAAPGAGIVSSFTLQSDDLDEIDWEWLGGSPDQCQSNYFGKGDTTTYDRGAFHGVSGATTSFHTYSIDWTSERVQWIIDGNVVRTLNYADAQGGDRYPQTPMQVRLGTWVGGQEGNSEGTIEWAGGLANFDEAPFKAYYKSITITDYANGAENAKEYVYDDDSGSFGSIRVVTKSDSTTSEESSTKTASITSSKTGSTLEEMTTETTMTTATRFTSNSTITTSSSQGPTSTPEETGQAELDLSSAASSCTVEKAIFVAVAFAIGALAL